MKNSQQGRHLAPPSTTKNHRSSPSRSAHAARGEDHQERIEHVHIDRRDSADRTSKLKHQRITRCEEISPETGAIPSEAAISSADYSMKKRGLFIAGYICLMLAFLTGAIEVLSFKEARVSESENRMLQGFPEFSISTVISGDFMSQMESYLSDAFFFRDEAADFTEKQLGLFALPDEGPDNWEVDAEHLDAPVTDDETSEEEAESIQIADAAEAAEPEAVEISADYQVDPSDVSSSDFYLLNDAGEKTVLYTFSAEQMASFATMLNMYRDALPEDGTLHYAVPPVSYQANNILQKHNYTGWGSDLDDVLQDVVNDGIYVYDVTDILTPYLETSRLYPVEDHHWHPLSASLVCEEMLRNQGVPPMNYYEYRYYVSSVPGYVTFYGDELKNLSLTADTVEMMQPVSPVESYMLKHLTERSSGVFVDETQMGLLAYLGGLKGPWRLFETGFHTGRNAIMVTDSFGLTFAPFLAPYYDTILFVDLRESLFNLDISGGTIRDYIEYYDIDDMYMLSSAFNEDIVDGVQSRLFKYLG